MQYPEQEILDRFGVDVIDIGRVFNDRDEDWYDVKLADGSTGQYPSWFHPQKQENGGWLVYDSEHTLIAKMPVGATFSIRHISRIWKIIRMITAIWIIRWEKCSGVLWYTAHGIMREIKTFIRRCGRRFWLCGSRRIRR